MLNFDSWGVMIRFFPFLDVGTPYLA
uniref:Uncharacterized protein n=1 Tax=Rhizophora mucronata TaxID=61149 RepID=A0A2P2QBT5_RHIMU